MHVGASVIFQNPGRARPDHEVYADDLRLARLAEPLGFESIWSVEHHFTDYTMCPDVMQFLTYMAACTERIRLGSMVCVLPWHDPVRVAEQIAMLDVMSGGRVILGIGRGTGRVEFDGFGVPMSESRARFVEVYNGHSGVNNAGDSLRAGTDEMWDVMLSLRHATGLPPVYGIAADDAHSYREYHDSVSRPGRGWIMVRARALTPAALAEAITSGDFHATTGVRLREVHTSRDRIRIIIDAEPGESYRTQFIGTRIGTALHGAPRIGAAGDTLRTTLRYDGVGEILAEVEGEVAEYRFRGDERYVRARIISTKPHIDPTTGALLGMQRAWVQPVWRR